MSDHQYKFNVTMTCGGCSGAVERVLKRLEGMRNLSTCLIAELTNNNRRQVLRRQPRDADRRDYRRLYSFL
jgi:NAD(P)H-nitrite reductase large subunit